MKSIPTADLGFNEPRSFILLSLFYPKTNFIEPSLMQETVFQSIRFFRLNPLDHL